MLKALVRRYLIKSKTILHSNKFILFLIGSLILYLIIYFNVIPHKSHIKINSQALTGTLISQKLDGNKLSLIIKTPEKIQVTYYIKSEEVKTRIATTLKLGMKIKVLGTLSIPPANTIPNTFNYQKYLYHNKIYYLMQAQDIKIINTNVNVLYKLKNLLIQKISNMEYKEYYYAFILGEKYYIDQDVWQSYQKSGVTHLFAISGMHIALFIGLISKLCSFFKINSTFKNITIFSFLSFYLVLTDFAASILRAGVFFVFRWLNKSFNINLPNIKVLCFTVILLLFLNPNLLFNLGFLYSVLATFSLILGTSKHKNQNYFLNIIKTSLIINIVSLPLTLYNFYEINIFSFLFNCLFIPLVTFIIYPLILINFILPIFSFSCAFGLLIMEKLADLCAQLSLNIVIPKINILFIIIYYLSLFVLWYYKDFKIIIFLGLFIIFWKITPFLDANFYVYFLDVGQGDSILIRSEFTNNVIMIDTGGRLQYSKEEWEKQNHQYQLSDKTITFLKSLGITTIDWLILTHGDMDHMGESENLVNNVKIKNVIFNRDSFNDLEKNLITILNQKKINYYQNITQINMHFNKLNFLNYKIYDNENDNSNIIYLNYQNYKFLFMGDAGINAEKDLLKEYDFPNIDVLKVGHHGSKTSSSKEFLAKIQPKYAIISVGKNNRYGHPDSEVLANLQESKIFRTDINGSIIFKIKNKKLQIKTSASN